YPFFIDERTFVTVLAGYLEDMDGTFETYGRVSQGAITGTNAKDVEGRVRALGSDLSATFERTTLRTRLPATIAEYREKLFFTRLPLFALMLQIVGIVMYYVVMVSAMVVERQAGEIALLKSRGASNMQVMGVYALEAGLLCAAGVLIGPLVALGAIAMLGLTPPFEDLSGNKLLEVNLSTGAFLMAGLGALLTFAAMLWPAYRATAYSVVHYKTHLARPPQQPAFLRYYLDLALIGVGAFAFYQLRQRGSLVTERLFGDLSADPLLLATPALFMLMIALVFLRLFPLILRVVSWGTRRLNGATVPLGLWHLVRSPLQYSRLILLLLLVTAVGMFAAGFRATLERSYDDRAGYEAGAEGRLQGVRDQGRRTTGAFVQKVGSVTGAATVSPALRIDASYSPRDISSQAITLLGVERESFEQVAFWRGDFAGRGLGGLLDTLQGDGTDEGEGVVIPGGTRFVGVWVKLSLRGNFTSLGMRVRDAEGLHWQYRLEPAGSPPTAAAPGEARADGWRFYVASLARPSAFGGPGGTPSLLEDRRVDSFYVQLGGNPMVAERHTLLLDDVTASREGAEPASWALTGFPDGVVVEDFENLERYELISGAARGAERGALARADGGANGGRFVANVAFEYSRSAARVAGLRLQAGTPVLPVAINQPFAAENKLKVGDELRLYTNAQYVTARVASVFELFPSYDPERQRRFIVADLGALQLAATRVPGPAEGLFVNEAWLAGLEGPVPTREDLVKNGLQTDLVFDRALIHAQQASDPLVAASWEGILFLAFAAVLVLTALGFIVSSHLAAQTRALEFAILRTMGFTRRQIFALVTFEQAFVIVIGLVAGTLMGLPLVRLMVGYLGLTETGSDVLPPLASRVSWEAVAISSSLLVLVFIATNMSLVVAYSRLAVHRALRMGEL
ncbi:MAG: FtsX-like permease family protein, partial [Tepidiformaceae bacterium]